MSVAPIGVFDSGVGGLSILGDIRQLLPHEALLYVADSAHAPYGPKGEEFIRARCAHIMQFFLRVQVKAVVLACNTATAAAIAEMRRQYAIPIIGVEPALKPAAALSRSGVIGVLATSGTIASDKFLQLQSRFVAQVEIITRACPGLVENIEQLVPNAAALDRMLKEFIQPMLDRGVDTLVLGCTHYCLVRDLIQQVAGPAVNIVDTGSAVAKELQRRLVLENLLNGSEGPGTADFFTSGIVESQRHILERYWKSPVTLSQLVDESNSPGSSIATVRLN